MSHKLTGSGNFKTFCRCAAGLHLWHFMLLLTLFLLLSKDNTHVTSLDLRRLLDDCDVLKLLCKIVEDRTAGIHMCHLASAETNRYLNFVTLLKELPRSSDLRIEIVRIDVRGHADLLDLHDMLLPAGFLLAAGLLITILSVINDLAYRRMRRRRNLDQVDTVFLRLLIGFTRRHDAELLTFRSDQPDFLVAYLFIDLYIVTSAVNCLALLILLRKIIAHRKEKSE